ncbi:alpha/beta fold hydrolase [Haematospirillum sp. 15-248]|uniref:alpha/beta fold hydrolase n=1 Tax=Haematospirillum sp. 15-248 TaxID=2723107 RepID=UPI00143AF5BE|nr:alpha/beta fold hydrolase [Haematospirillum sp. 15-248]NKD88680.1 alpha/beta fold hydrolase [Haematospirillum sp. 15-248]
MTLSCRLSENRSVYALLDRALSDDPSLAEQALFLNWGYEPIQSCATAREAEHGTNARHIRLVHELLADTPLDGRTVLDVGCGRGGLLSVLAARCSPRRLSGLDLCPENIAFCRSLAALQGIRFQIADACCLPQPDASVDVLVNLESAGAYPDLPAFLGHVARVLRMDGVFLYGDVLPADSVPAMVGALDALGLELIDDRDITANVLAARRQSGDTERQLFKRVDHMPAALSDFLDTYRAASGSPIFCAMESGRIVYRLMRYRKIRRAMDSLSSEMCYALKQRDRLFHEHLVVQKSQIKTKVPVSEQAGKVSCWLPWTRPVRSDAAVRLFCLPWSGGSASIYRGWERFLPAGIEVCPVELPGRGTRFADPLIDAMGTLIPEMAVALEPFLDRPFALFGHSLGALLAFELSSFLNRSRGYAPVHVFVSGRRPPQEPSEPPFRHCMDDESLKRNLVALGGMPEEVQSSPELLALLLPVLRSDFRLTEQYSYDGQITLGSPLTAYVGSRDPEVSVSVMQDWNNVSADTFSLRTLDGDHFYLLEPESRRHLLMHLGATLLGGEYIIQQEAAE